MDGWLFLPLLALGLDAILGDPRTWPHPVRWLGLVLNKLEYKARAWAGQNNGAGRSHEFSDKKFSETERARRLRLAGAAAVALTAGGAAVLVWLLSSLPGLGWLVALYFAYAGLALRGLVQEVDLARQTLLHEGVAAGRLAVSGLVSRDVSAADEDDLYRALAETLAENFNDAVVAPFFWLCLAGPAGLWAYKAVSTMDSMWGYKTGDWRDLGWAGARADDVLAWLPARLSALILCVFSGKAGEGAAQWPGWVIIGVEARKMSSPNAGWPMSAAAWLSNRAMGGPTLYHGEIVEKPRLGPEGVLPWDNAALLLLLARVRRAGLLGCALLWGLFEVVRGILFSY